MGETVSRAVAARLRPLSAPERIVTLRTICSVHILRTHVVRGEPSHLRELEFRLKVHLYCVLASSDMKV